VFGSRHSAPAFFGLGIVPTRGQGLFIFYIIAINVILSAVGHKTYQPNAWFPTTQGSTGEVVTYFTNRVGVLSFANMPLLILFAGRNNILLWVTNWSHSTFLLLHRWVAYIATLQAILHSIVYLRMRIESGTHATESKLPYWIWGAVATISMSVLIPTSVLPLRKKLYELFLVWHIALSILSVAGCYLHILYRFQHQWGYEIWMFAAFAVWGFDRIMRIARLARNGVKKATITLIDDDYVRVNIEGVSGGGHAYLYFPTLTWRVWENHPFSVASTILPLPTGRKDSQSDEDIEKNGTLVSRVKISDDGSETSSSHRSAKIGLTFLLRTRGGLTAQIRSHLSLPVLVESPYGAHEDLSSYPTLICIAGGVGITAVVPFLRVHPGERKLFWGSRSHALVDDNRDALAGVDKELYIGKRMVVADVLEKELGGGSEDAVVVVSGPPGMADEARMAVNSLGRRNGKGSIKLIEESFSW
jgi:predicted ferric reductase